MDVRTLGIDLAKSLLHVQGGWARPDSLCRASRASRVPVIASNNFREDLAFVLNVAAIVSVIFQERC
jgi:hypothetical protein